MIADRLIAKNTILLMIRMGLLMILNLIAVRFVRNGLGVDNYGILSAITGVVQLLVCLNAVLAISGQRYMNTAMSETNDTRLRDCFHVNLHLCIILSIVTFILFETVGLWFMATQMNYPPDRFMAVMITYQATIVTFISMLIQVPYLSAVMAHERMNIFAWITILEGVVKFVLAFSLPYIVCDGMIFYGCGLSIASIISTLLYVCYCRTHFSEAKAHKVIDRKLYQEMFTFSGWTLYGSVAAALMLQGNMILLNFSYGPRANAAFAIGLQLYNALGLFGNNIMTAIKPQLTINLSQGNHASVKRLFNIGNIALLASLILIVIPLEIFMQEILTLWLGEVDAWTVSFSRILLLAQAVLLLGSPITCVMQAAGYVRQYHLPVESIILLALPLAGVMFCKNLAAESACYAILFCVTLAHFVRLERIYKYYFKQR